MPTALLGTRRMSEDNQDVPQMQRRGKPRARSTQKATPETELPHGAAPEDSGVAAAPTRRRVIKPVRRASRRDPKNRRHQDGTAAWLRLHNRHPDLHYVCVSEAGDAQGLGPQYYADMGYFPVEVEPGGVEWGAGARTARKGEQMRMQGTVLMACHREDLRDIEENGPDGVTGQLHADALERKIIRGGGVDSFRGHLGGNHLRAVLGEERGDGAVEI